MYDHHLCLDLLRKVKHHNIHWHFQLPNFWNASQLITPNKTYNFPLPEHSEKFHFLRSEGFVYEAQAIRDSLIKGKLLIISLKGYENNRVV